MEAGWATFWSVLDLVEDDLNGNLILPRFAEKIFGAVSSRDGSGLWRVDGDKTEQRRAEIKRRASWRPCRYPEFISLERERKVPGRMAAEVRVMYNQSLDFDPLGEMASRVPEPADDFAFGSGR